MSRIFVTIDLHDRHFRSANCCNPDVSPVRDEKFTRAMKCLAKALAASGVAPLASAGIGGGVGVAVGDGVALTFDDDDDGSGNGFGRAVPSVHPERPSPTKAATAASVRTVRA